MCKPLYIYKVCLVALAMMFVAPATLNAQEETEQLPIVSYLQNAMRFNMFNPQEKVYMHFDNTGYFKGETIRFKAYITRCDTWKKTDLSHILYVELVDPTGDVVEKRKLKIENGEAVGDIKVDSIMTTGFYEVRAYTRYMTNWGTHACFSRVFPIFKAPKKEGDYKRLELDQFSFRKRLPNARVDEDSVIVQTYTHAMTARFYPEGGDLVEGLKSRVAFTLSDETGRRKQEKVYIENEKKQRVLDTRTDSLGRGLFDFTPEAGHTYTMFVEGNKKAKFDLPKAKAEGCVLNVDMFDEIDIKATVTNSLGMQGRLLGYAIMYNGTIIECDTMTAQPVNTFAYNRFVLPKGVNQLTVFDSDGHIQAERLFFVYPEPSPTDSIKITSNTAQLTPCCKVSFKIQTEPNSSLSFSAIDAGSINNGWEGNIKTWTLLASEVRGYIDHPEYYFESDDREHRRNADLLMLIQGWRRYDFEVMCGTTPFERKQPIEDKLYLFGQVKSKRKKYSADDVELSAFMYNRKGERLEGTLKTDSLGNYNYILPDVDGDWSLQFISKKDDKDRNYFIGIDRHFSPDKRYIYPDEARLQPLRSPNFTPTFKDAKEEEEYVSITKRTHLLPTVQIRTRRLLGDINISWFDEKDAKLASVLRYNCDDDADKAADEGELEPAFYEWLQERNSFFDFERNPDPDYRKSDDGGVVMSDLSVKYNNRPIVWIIDNTFAGITNIPTSQQSRLTIYDSNNNTNVVNWEMLSEMTIDEINTVYISEDIAATGKYVQCDALESLNAVVIYVFRHPTFTGKQKGLRRTHFEGFNVPTAFEMEDYSIVPPSEDFRRTLFWEPNVKTDNRGRATIEFYNNSSCQQMFISAEGMTDEGKFLINE